METQQKKSPAGFGPGPALAKVRQDLGLSHEEVAARLHLAARQIAALESDDYDSLPGATYIRGYLRSYAELLGLAPAAILDAYAHMPVSAKSSNLSSLAPKEEITSQHRHVQLVTYFVVAVIIALAVSWWQGRDSQTRSVPTSAAVSPGASIPSELAVDSLASPMSQSAPATAVQLDTAGARMMQPSVVTPAPAPAPTAAPAHVRVAPAQVRFGAAVASKHPTAAPVAVERATGVAAVTPLQPAAAPAAGARARLVLHTDQDSWVDIRDARDNKLLYETVPAGRVVTLDGDAPLSVFLGNAAGVRLEFDGKPFDASPFTRGQVARFTLGAAHADH